MEFTYSNKKQKELFFFGKFLTLQWQMIYTES